MSRDRLTELCSVLVDAASFPGDLWFAVDELYRMLAGVTGLQSPEDAPDVATETILATGQAIAPIEAARCIYDHLRTRAFAGAVVDEITRRRRSDPSRPVHVLYAGCGPFATLLLPALTRFGDDELRGTLIDVHQPSIDAVRRLVAELGFERTVGRIVQADASTYVLPDDEPVDVIVAECLQRGLSREPHVAVVRNLVNQAGPDVTLIPRRISLSLVRAGPDAGLAEPNQELMRVARDPVFVLDVESVRHWGPPTAGHDRLPARTARIEEPVEPPARIALATTIRVDDERELDDYDSWLTSPHPLDLSAPVAVGAVLHLAYDTAAPGIVVDAYDSPPSRPPAVADSSRT